MIKIRISNPMHTHTIFCCRIYWQFGQIKWERSHNCLFYDIFLPFLPKKRLNIFIVYYVSYSLFCWITKLGNVFDSLKLKQASQIFIHLKILANKITYSMLLLKLIENVKYRQKKYCNQISIFLMQYSEFATENFCVRRAKEIQ